LRVLRAVSSVISGWRGTAELLTAARLTYIVCLVPSRRNSQP
jgi:hypothetical protein